MPTNPVGGVFLLANSACILPKSAITSTPTTRLTNEWRLRLLLMVGNYDALVITFAAIRDTKMIK
jgi:hypothetical protein